QIISKKPEDRSRDQKDVERSMAKSGGLAHPALLQGLGRAQDEADEQPREYENQDSDAEIVVYVRPECSGRRDDCATRRCPYHVSHVVTEEQLEDHQASDDPMQSDLRA